MLANGGPRDERDQMQCTKRLVHPPLLKPEVVARDSVPNGYASSLTASLRVLGTLPRRSQGATDGFIAAMQYEDIPGHDTHDNHLAPILHDAQ